MPRTFRHMIHSLAGSLLLFGLAFGRGPAAAACPNCAESTEDQAKTALADGQSTNIALGYSLSIFFMLGVPMSLVGGLGYAIYRMNQAETAALTESERTQRIDS